MSNPGYWCGGRETCFFFSLRIISIAITCNGMGERERERESVSDRRGSKRTTAKRVWRVHSCSVRSQPPHCSRRFDPVPTFFPPPPLSLSLSLSLSSFLFPSFTSLFTFPPAALNYWLWPGLTWFHRARDWAGCAGGGVWGRSALFHGRTTADARSSLVARKWK